MNILSIVDSKSIQVPTLPGQTIVDPIFATAYPDCENINRLVAYTNRTETDDGVEYSGLLKGDPNIQVASSLEEESGALVVLISVNTFSEIFRKTIYLGVSFDGMYESFVTLNIAICSLSVSSNFYIQALNGTESNQLAWTYPINFENSDIINDPLPARYFNSSYSQCNSSINFNSFFDSNFRYDYRPIAPIEAFSTNYTEQGDFQVSLQFDEEQDFSEKLYLKASMDDMQASMRMILANCGSETLEVTERVFNVLPSLNEGVQTI